MYVMNVLCCEGISDFPSSLIYNPSCITTMDIYSSVVNIASRWVCNVIVVISGCSCLVWCSFASPSSFARLSPYKYPIRHLYDNITPFYLPQFRQPFCCNKNTFPQTHYIIKANMHCIVVGWVLYISDVMEVCSCICTTPLLPITIHIIISVCLDDYNILQVGVDAVIVGEVDMESSPTATPQWLCPSPLASPSSYHRLLPCHSLPLSVIAAHSCQYAT